MKKSAILFITLVVLLACSKEENIRINQLPVVNGSFEGFPRLGTGSNISLDNWLNCGFPDETAPDVHPVPNSLFQVTKEAYDGETYLGLVVRDNDTWEGVGQYMRTPIHDKRTYKITIYLARSPLYEGISRITNESASYTTPSILRIWGGQEHCKKQELLVESVPIDHEDWQEYTFQFDAQDSYQYILLEAFYDTAIPHPYNGHIILDKFSIAEIL